VKAEITRVRRPMARAAEKARKTPEKRPPQERA
jgi:hypothetical protein